MKIKVRVLMAAVALLTCACLNGQVWTGARSTGEEVVVDNTRAEITGAWQSSDVNSGYYGMNYLFTKSGNGSNKVVWRPRLTAGGDYAVYYRLPNGSADRVPDAVLSVRHASGIKSFFVDQRVTSSGEWRLLGSFPFVSGVDGFVELTDRASRGYVVADAVKFVPRER